MTRKSPIKPTGLSLIFNCPLPFNFRYKRGLVACPLLTSEYQPPFSGGREEEIVERRGWGERERKFLSLRCLPFSHLSLPFPPETPDTQAGVLGS